MINPYPIITPNPWFALGFTVGVVCSMGWDKYIITCIYNFSIIKSVFTYEKHEENYKKVRINFRGEIIA